MKICLVSEYFYPKSKGGTEKYVYELAKKLISEKNEVEVITTGSRGMENYTYENILVRVIEEEKSSNPSIISGREPSLNLDAFMTLLKVQQYELVHFHTLTPSFGIHHINCVKALAIQLYFTAHVPNITCIHGDLMQYGEKACDGKIIPQRCMACYLSKKQIPKGLSILAASLINQLNYPKSIANVVKQKQQDLSRLNTLCDRIFIFTNWQKRIFIENGINENKLVLTQQMTVPASRPNELSFVQKKDGRIKIAFIGRICHEKGLHILLAAIKALENEPLELHIAAIIENKNDPYFLKMMALSKDQPNIYWSYNLDNHAIQDFYQSVDLICIPSIWYETGPYVLYEAFKYKLPVIANNLGDMEVWQQKGYPIKLYNDLDGLITQLKKLLPVALND